MRWLLRCLILRSDFILREEFGKKRTFKRAETASFLRVYGILYNYVVKIENSSRKSVKDVV